LVKYTIPYFKKNSKVECLVSSRYLVCAKESLDNALQYQNIIQINKLKIIQKADEICSHIFDLLGSGPVDVNRNAGAAHSGYKEIDWHKDFKNGYRWNNKIIYYKIQFGEKKGVDIKVAWELSLFQHLTLLGQAYSFTGNKKYANEFKNQIEDWIKDNPVGYGINWNCSMEIAIRIANWLTAMEFFTEDTAFSESFLDKFYTSIHEQAKFIFAHQEHSGLHTNNHYIANLAGLFFTAVYCPFYPESKKWRNFSIRELTKEITKQVYDDGCCFEGSTSYHRLSYEMFFYCFLLGTRAGIHFPETYEKKLKDMVSSTLFILKPDGTVPQIGDNDNGRFLVFCDRPVLEHKYMVPLAAVLFKESEFRIPQIECSEEVFWLFGSNGLFAYERMPFRTEPRRSKSFRNAGWHVLRDGMDEYCFVSCGQNGQNGNGGHSHNDKLSIELMTKGRTIFTDPGTFAYTADSFERNRYRSTEYHNTVKITGFEQNDLSHQLFRLPDRVKIAYAHLVDTDHAIAFTGKIRYAGMEHKRVIFFNKNRREWMIWDTLAGFVPFTGKLIFHLSPEMTSDGYSIYAKDTNEKIAHIKTSGFSFTTEEYDYSPEYGKKIKAKRLISSMLAVNGEGTFLTSITY
jgi:hypothetical protein